MDEGARLLEQALEVARAGGDRRAIARAAAALSWLLDLQVQFMPAARIADAALDEIGEGDDLETALLLVRRATAINDGSDAVDGPRDDAERALDDRRARAATVASSSRRCACSPRSGAANLRRGASSNGSRWRAARGTRRPTPPRPSAAPRSRTSARTRCRIAERAVELCEARGLRERLAWSHYVRVEIGLVSGDWDGAVAAARRALDIGVLNGYDRAVVRTWSAVLPIASARNDERLLDESHAWLTERFREPESPSPYALIVGAARQLEIASRGLREPFVPDVEERLALVRASLLQPELARRARDRARRMARRPASSTARAGRSTG